MKLNSELEVFIGRCVAGIIIMIIAVTIIFATVFLWSKLRVMNAESVGRAEYARAEQNRKIMIKTAESERDASKLRAEAITIIGQSAKDFPEYRQQEFIGAFAEALKDGKINQIIYVPTEANIPVLEAGKR